MRNHHLGHRLRQSAELPHRINVSEAISIESWVGVDDVRQLTYRTFWQLGLRSILGHHDDLRNCRATADDTPEKDTDADDQESNDDAGDEGDLV